MAAWALSCGDGQVWSLPPSCSWRKTGSDTAGARAAPEGLLRPPGQSLFKGTCTCPPRSQLVPVQALHRAEEGRVFLEGVLRRAHLVTQAPRGCPDPLFFCGAGVLNFYLLVPSRLQKASSLLLLSSGGTTKGAGSSAGRDLRSVLLDVFGSHHVPLPLGRGGDSGRREVWQGGTDHSC